MAELPLNSSKLTTKSGIKQYSIRILMLFSAITAAIASHDFSNFNILHWSLVSILAVYTIASGFWIDRSEKTLSDNTFELISMLDAFAVGFIISKDGALVVPIGIFYSMLTLSNLINYGTEKWLKISFYFVCGILFGFFITQGKWEILGNTQNTVICLFGLMAYISAYAFYANRNIFKLIRLNSHLAKEYEVYKRRTYKVSQYLTPTVREMIRSGDESSLQTERKRITVFFSDIKGFSSLSEEIESETLTYLLNTYLTEMSAIAAKYRGTIDKFMGDGIMILFGDSKSDGVKADCLRSISMAVDMRRKMKSLQTQWYNQGIKKPLKIRMGINTGFCTVGSFGTSHYRDYTALGTHVNLASRLESAAQEGQIYVSHETWSLVKDVVLCRDKGEINVKGFSHPVKVYQVVDFRKHLGQSQTYFEENVEGFSLHMDLEKIKNYDRDRLLEYIEDVALRLKDE